MKTIFNKRFLIVFCVLATFKTLSQEQVDSSSIYAPEQPEQFEVSPSVLTPPPGWLQADNFNGYLYTSKGSAIYISGFNHVNFELMGNGMNEEYYKRKGLTPVSEGRWKSAYGNDILYYKSSYLQNNTPYIRYTVLVEMADQQTIWLHIAYPISEEEELEHALVASIQKIDLTKIERK